MKVGTKSFRKDLFGDQFYGTLAQRDAHPMFARKQEVQLFHVESEGKTYHLVGGKGNAYWQEFTFASENLALSPGRTETRTHALTGSKKVINLGFTLAQADTVQKATGTSWLLSVSGNVITHALPGDLIDIEGVLDDQGAALVPGEVYFLSKTTAGAVTRNKPVEGEISVAVLEVYNPTIARLIDDVGIQTEPTSSIATQAEEEAGTITTKAATPGGRTSWWKKILFGNFGLSKNNPTYGIHQLGGSHKLEALATPTAPTVTTVGAKGATGVAEVASLGVTGACTVAGNVTVTLDGVATAIALATTDNTADLVASKIRGTTFTGWTTGGTTSTVTFTCNTTGAKADATYADGGTGATGTMTTTTQGVTDTRTTYTYFVVAEDRNGFKTLASAAGSIADGNPTLDAVNYNTVSWPALEGAVLYYLLKTNTGTLLGSTTGTSLNDQGQVTSAFTAPTRNTTADFITDGRIEANEVVKNGVQLTGDFVGTQGQPHDNANLSTALHQPVQVFFTDLKELHTFNLVGRYNVSRIELVPGASGSYAMRTRTWDGTAWSPWTAKADLPALNTHLNGLSDTVQHQFEISSTLLTEVVLYIGRRKA